MLTVQLRLEDPLTRRRGPLFLRELRDAVPTFSGVSDSVVSRGVVGEIPVAHY